MKKETMQSLTPEMVLQSVLELRKELKISSETTEKILAESEAKTRKIIAESTAETEKLLKEVGKQIKETNTMVNGIGKSNGDMAEEAIYNVLDQDKKFAGIKFKKIRKNIPIVSEELETLTEIDLLMENGDTIAIIEIKYKVKKKYIMELITTKLKNFRKYFPFYKNHKIIFGVGGMSFDKEAIKEATAKGIGIIKVVGNKIEYQTKHLKIY